MKIYAVYQHGWRGADQRSVAFGDGVTSPPMALIGLCRDQAKADRIARRIRRMTRKAVALGLRSREALVGVREYDPRDFLLPHDRAGLTRRQAHPLVAAGMLTRREQLGVR